MDLSHKMALFLRNVKSFAAAQSAENSLSHLSSSRPAPFALRSDITASSCRVSARREMLGVVITFTEMALSRCAAVLKSMGPEISAVVSR
jgi:hypothetical protein